MFKKILFCTDFSENSHYAFSYALNLAKTYKFKLILLHVTPEPAHPELLSIYLSHEKLEELRISQRKELEDQLQTHYFSKMGQLKNYQVLIKQGEAFVEIIQTARKEKVNLIAMGTHG